MPRLKRIGFLFGAKLQALQMAAVGLIAGIAYSFGGALYESATGTLNTGTALAFMALIGMPVLFGAVGFVVGGVGALLYNSIARWIGGIEIDIVQEP